MQSIVFNHFAPGNYTISFEGDESDMYGTHKIYQEDGFVVACVASPAHVTPLLTVSVCTPQQRQQKPHAREILIA